MNSFTHIKAAIAKEFQKRTAQEYKNNADFVLHVNQSINALNECVDTLSQENTKLKNEMASLKLHQDNSYDIFADAVNEELEKYKVDAAASLSNFQKNLIEIEKKVKSLDERFPSKGMMEESFMNIFAAIHQCESEAKKVKDFVISMEHKLIGNMVASMANMRKEILDKFPDFHPYMTAVEERFKAMYVDFSGLIKEIEILKRRLNYDDKKFENIYTLIDRLKKDVT